MIRFRVVSEPGTDDAMARLHLTLMRDAADALEPKVADLSRLWTNKIRDLVSRKQYPPASRPGESPARRTGNLQRGFQTIPTHRFFTGEGVVLQGGVENVNADYANILDRGGLRAEGGFMEARPYSRPALAQVLAAMDARIAAALR